MEKAEKMVLYDFEGEKSLSQGFRNRLAERAETMEVVESPGDYSGKLKEKHLKDAEVLISRVFDDYTEDMFEDSDLELVVVMATDSSHYPEILARKGVELRDAGSYATESVAELTISMMLQLSLRTYRTERFVEDGKWDVGPFTGNELSGKKLGVLGLGSIGSRTAELAEAFDMDISYFARSEKEDAGKKGWNFESLEEIVETSDVIALHLPLTEGTRNLLDADMLERTKDSAIILNAAREELQDVGKTIELCSENKLLAWFDALENEDDRKELLKTENAVLTSHSGCATHEAQQRLREKTIQNIDDYLG